MMPARVAMAVQADGWWVRSDNIFAKENPQPESVTDRPTRAHEYVFLLTKSGSSTYWTHRDGPGTRVKPPPDYRYQNAETGEEVVDPPDGWDAPGSPWRRLNLWRGHDYFYDPMGFRLPFTGGAHARRKDGERKPAKGSDPMDRRAGTWKEPTGWDTELGSHGSIHKDGRQGTGKQRGHSRRHAGFNDRWDAMSKDEQQAGGANLRTVWSMATHPFPEAHFATFPPALVERCIKLGTSEKGACSRCGAPWIRKVKKTKNARGVSTYGSENGRRLLEANYGARELGRDHDNPFLAPETLGWRPGCDCGAAVAPCTVLDPFGGSGTTGLVADKLGRHAILIELNPEYVEMARNRIQDDARC